MRVEKRKNTLSVPIISELGMGSICKLIYSCTQQVFIDLLCVRPSSRHWSPSGECNRKGTQRWNFHSVCVCVGGCKGVGGGEIQTKKTHIVNY